jgi:integrase
MKRKKSTTIEASGVRVRLFRRGARYWLDVRRGDSRTRVSADTADRAIAEARADELAKEIAKQELLGVTPDTLTLGQLFAAYTKERSWTQKPQWRRAAETRTKLFLAAWGETFPVAQISQSSVDRYCAERRAGRVAPALRAKRLKTAADAIARGEPATALPAPLRDGALDSDFSWLSSVFNWARGHKLPSGKRLLDHNPLHDCRKALPKETAKMVRRPKATEERYVRTLARTDEVDPEGGLRLILALARYTGRRESAIIQLRVSDVLLSPRAVTQALAAAGYDVADGEKMPHGAIRWSDATDKQGVLHITAISNRARAELDRYLARHSRIGDVPLFPGPEDETLSISRVLAYRWLMKAEQLAELPKLTGGGFHPYRRLWASERKHLADVDVAAAGGWGSTKTLAIYQQSDPTSVLAAVMNAG